MSFKTSNDTIINEESLSASKTSEEIIVTNQYLIALQTSWSNGASPAMEVNFEASLDKQNWVELSSPSTTISGVSGSDIIQLTEFAYKYLRATVTVTSGSADISVVFNAKGI